MAEGAGEVALVGEAGSDGDFSERRFRIEKQGAAGTDAQTARVFADTLAMEAAEDAGKMDGMHASFGAEVVEGEMAGVFGVEFFEDAGEPGGRVFAFFESEAGGEAGEFSEQAFDAEGIGILGGEGFAEEIHAEPEERAATRVFAAVSERARAFGDALFPARTEFDMEETQAARSDFVLVGNAGGAEHQGHRRELFLFAAVAFAVVATKEQAKEGQFVGMHGELAGDGMAKIAEDRAGVLQAMPHRAIELAATKGLVTARIG